MSIGSGTGATYDLAGLAEHDRMNICTRVHLVLPFGIPGLNGTYEIETTVGSWQAGFDSKHMPPIALEPHLEGCQFTLDERGFIKEFIKSGGITVAPKQKLVTIEPDRWGRSWRSEVWLQYKGFLDPGRPEDNPPGEIAAVSRILPACCICLNRVLDVVALVGGVSNLPLLTPSDFWSFRVSYHTPDKEIGSLAVTGLQTLWWRSANMFDDDIRLQIQEALTASAELPLHDALLVSARRKLEHGDFRGSIIDAICAVEAVLDGYLKGRLRAIGISNTKTDAFLGPNGPGLSDRVHILLPILNGLGVTDELRSAFSSANTKRNHIVHRGDAATKAEAETCVGTCRMMVEQVLLMEAGSPPAPPPPAH
jgi:hypothetical protein